MTELSWDPLLLTIYGTKLPNRCKRESWYHLSENIKYFFLVFDTTKLLYDMPFYYHSIFFMYHTCGRKERLSVKVKFIRVRIKVSDLHLFIMWYSTINRDSLGFNHSKYGGLHLLPTPFVRKYACWVIHLILQFVGNLVSDFFLYIPSNTFLQEAVDLPTFNTVFDFHRVCHK